MKFCFRRAAAMLLALVMLLALCACGGEEKAPETEELPAPAKPTEELPAPAKPVDTPTPEPTPAGEDYLERITFLGDSTTYGLGYYDMVDDARVWTPASGTLALFNQSWATIVYPATKEEIPIRDAVTDAKPDILCITLGVNGVSMMDEAAFKAEYKALVTDIQSISPDTKIICNSMYPVEADYEHIDSINNVKITAANGWIADVAAECGVKYIDTYSKLVGADGFLVEDYGNGDGIHLDPDGFEIVLQNLMDNPV